MALIWQLKPIKLNCMVTAQLLPFVYLVLLIYCVLCVYFIQQPPTRQYLVRTRFYIKRDFS